MKSKQQSPIWPYLGILAFLFVLSLTAPRAWDRTARHHVARLATESKDLETLPPIDSVVAVESVETMHLDALEAEAELAIEEEASQANNPPSTVDEFTLPAFEIVPPAPEFAEEVQDAVEVVEPDEPDESVEIVDRASPAEPEPALELPENEPPAEPDDVPVAVATSAWPTPRVLLEQLAALGKDDPQLTWPGDAIELVRELCQYEQDYPATKAIIDRLRDLTSGDASVPPADSAMAAQAARTRYALVRWVDIWDSVASLREVPLGELTGDASYKQIGTCLADFNALKRDEIAKDAWREYLKLDALRVAAGQDDDARRAAARTVLDRLASRRLTREQRQFIEESPLDDLKQALRPWAAEPVVAERLLAHLEQYEYSRRASDARHVANDFRGLNWSAPEAAERLSKKLHTHYRNANVRVAIAGPLLNRMIPQPGWIDAPVRDQVVNVPVRGSSSTFTELSVKLIPDARRIRLGLEAQGVVASRTISTSGPATFRNRGQSTFLVRKLFVLGPHGLSIFPAIAEAENNYNYLISLETNFDSVPLVGSLVQTIARNQHDEVRDQARQQTARKVAIRALHELDSEAEARAVEAGEKLEQKQLATLRRLGLELTPVSLSTTEKRIVARARLASPVQLGAHTPRPRAPSDSWLSMQVNQSALNNGLEQLDLDGRSFEIAELFAWVAKKLDRPELADIDELPEDVQLTFADKDAVRLSCQDGQVRVTFALAELTHGRKHWRDFQVHTSYAPEADGLVPRFVRDDTIHLDGRSVQGRIEFKLRAIFSKVLSKNRDLRLLDESITGDERLKDLQITQFAVEDGWIALAYSPKRRASRVARQPE